MKSRSFLIKIVFSFFLFTLFLILIVLSAELIFRFTNKYPLAAFQLSDNEIWRIEKKLYNKKVTEEGTHFILTTNEDGFRGEKPFENNPDSVIRILILGDSYTAGLDYSDEQIFTGCFSSLVNSDTLIHKKFEVINTGVPAWAIDQQWQYFLNNGLKLHPDYVLLIASPNDIRETFCKKFVTSTSINELTVHHPEFSITKKAGWYLSTRFSFFQYLQEKVFKSNYGTMADVFEMYPVNFGTEDQTDWDRPLYLKKPFQDITAAQNLYEKIFVEIKDKCTEQNIKFGTCLNVVLTRYDSTYSNDTSCSVNVIENYFRQLTDKYKIPFLNLNTAADSLSHPRELFMRNDYHYCQEGHRFVGEKLYSFFKVEFLSQPMP